MWWINVYDSFTSLFLCAIKIGDKKPSFIQDDGEPGTEYAIDRKHYAEVGIIPPDEDDNVGCAFTAEKRL